jgi:hypothetical protein
VKQYTGPLGLLPVKGDHVDAVALLERFLDVKSADRPNLISPLMGEQAAVYALSKTAPSSAPTGMLSLIAKSRSTS